MSELPKRKRVEKTQEKLRTEYSDHKANFYCCRCGTAYSRQKGYFPVSHSPMYRGSGYLPFCTECVDEMFAKYRKQFGNDKDAVHHMCMKLDIYWGEDLWALAERSTGSMSKLRAYIGKSNLVRYIDKGYDDTLREEQAKKIEQIVPPDGTEPSEPQEPAEPAPPPIEIDPAVIDFWGKGYDPEFYLDLERRYSDWTKGDIVDDPSTRALYKQICLLEAIITRDSAEGKAIDKNVNMLNTLLGSMNLKPTQKKDEGDGSLEKTPFGVWIRRWENERPVPEVDPELDDVDGIVRYIEIWLRGHLSKMLNIKNSYSKMYEDEIERLRVEHPEYEEDDDETLFNDIFDTGGGT